MTEQFPRKLYGRRKGPKLSPHKAELRQTLLPKLALKIVPGADPRTYFHAVTDVWLEVGFGAGEHLLTLARAHPNVGLIGAEPYEAGVAKLLSKIATLTPSRSPSAREFPLSVGGKQGAATLSSPCKKEVDPAKRSEAGWGGGLLPNIRIHEGDAREIIEALPDACLGRVFILFPDPWPKTRHHKRRFIQTEMLDQLARVMKERAELRFASDDAGYTEWTLERAMAHPGFIWAAGGPSDWKVRPAAWPQTRYEAKALHGPPVYLRFVRT